MERDMSLSQEELEAIGAPPLPGNLRYVVGVYDTNPASFDVAILDGNNVIQAVSDIYRSYRILGRRREEKAVRRASKDAYSRYMSSVRFETLKRKWE
jgi:hypothetical protein